jgi:hypothetical protein
MNQVRIDVVFWKLAVGIHFSSVDKWLLQREIFFDTSPVDSKNHTPDMPFDRRIRYPTEVQFIKIIQLQVAICNPLLNQPVQLF